MKFSYHGYGSTQDDEHLCRENVTEPVVIAGYKCSKSTTTVHVGTYTKVLSNLVTM